MDCRETTRILSEALNDSGVQFYIRFWAVFRKSIGERHSVVSDKSHIFQTEKRLEIIYSRFGGVANFIYCHLIYVRTLLKVTLTL